MCCSAFSVILGNRGCLQAVGGNLCQNWQGQKEIESLQLGVGLPSHGVLLDDDDDKTKLQASEQNKTASDMTRMMLECEQAANADDIGSPAEHDQNKENVRENVHVAGAMTTQHVAEARAGSQDHDQNFSKNSGQNEHSERANEKQGREFERANENQGKKIKRTNQTQMTYREALLGLDNSEPSSEDNSEPSSDF